ncbi:MAG: CHAT domain-containing protein [Deinococcales bacterium]
MHMAVSANYESTSPLDGKINFSGSENKDQAQADPTNLRVREFFELSLQGTDMVSISACETNIGSLHNKAVSELRNYFLGDELVSFTRALFYAGASSTITTLWQIDDETSAELMVKFYHYWQEQGLSKIEALSRAQLDIRQNYPNPYYWSGMILSGNWW